MTSLGVLEDRAVIWFMEELNEKQRLLLIRRVGEIANEGDYATQAAAFTSFLDKNYRTGRHDGAIAEQRRIAAWMKERADYLERVGSSFDHYDAGCLRREADAIEIGEHLGEVQA